MSSPASAPVSRGSAVRLAPIAARADRRGRPSKLTPERWAELLASIAGGAKLTDAARTCGVSPASVWGWIRDPRLARELGRAEGLAAAMAPASPLRELAQHDVLEAIRAAGDRLSAREVA